MTENFGSNLKKMLTEHKNEKGVSLYDHLCNLLQTIDGAEYQDKAHTELENISYFQKANNFQYEKLKQDAEVNTIKEVDTYGIKALCKKSKDFLDGSGSVASKTNLQDVQYDNRLWNIAGFGFSDQEAYHLQISLKRLCIKEDLKKLKFWGKIFCTNKNYFVAEGLHRKNVVDSVPENWEHSGVGINALSFWVTNDLMEDWTELPVIGPEHLCVAFETKAMLTGNLNAPIQTYPPFPGKEKHFLKAQIIRITFSSTLVPGGSYKLMEENDRDVTLDPDFAWPGREELYTNEKWVHQHPQVLKSGRVTHYIPKGLDEDAANELKGQLEEKEPYVERLRAITEDTRNILYLKIFSIRRL